LALQNELGNALDPPPPWNDQQIARLLAIITESNAVQCLLREAAHEILECHFRATLSTDFSAEAQDALQTYGARSVGSRGGPVWRALEQFDPVGGKTAAWEQLDSAERAKRLGDWIFGRLVWRRRSGAFILVPSGYYAHVLGHGRRLARQRSREIGVESIDEHREGSGGTVAGSGGSEAGGDESRELDPAQTLGVRMDAAAAGLSSGERWLYRHVRLGYSYAEIVRLRLREPASEGRVGASYPLLQLEEELFADWVRVLARNGYRTTSWFLELLDAEVFSAWVSALGEHLGTPADVLSRRLTVATQSAARLLAESRLLPGLEKPWGRARNGELDRTTREAFAEELDRLLARDGADPSDHLARWTQEILDALFHGVVDLLLDPLTPQKRDAQRLVMILSTPPLPGPPQSAMFERLGRSREQLLGCGAAREVVGRPIVNRALRGESLRAIAESSAVPEADCEAELQNAAQKLDRIRIREQHKAAGALRTQWHRLSRKLLKELTKARLPGGDGSPTVPLDEAVMLWLLPEKAEQLAWHGRGDPQQLRDAFIYYGDHLSRWAKNTSNPKARASLDNPLVSSAITRSDRVRESLARMPASSLREAVKNFGATPLLEPAVEPLAQTLAHQLVEWLAAGLKIE
jgi:hypothetical protein